jgi:hypothetical protein
MEDQVASSDGERQLPAIYVAQHRFLSEEVCLNGIAQEGAYLVKIGRGCDLADRMRSINMAEDGRDWRYIHGGWHFVAYREVLSSRLARSEEDSHKRFAEYRLEWNDRIRLVGGKNTGFELFLGGEPMIEAMRSEFIKKIDPDVLPEDVRRFCAADFHRTTKPRLSTPPKPRWQS